MNAQNDARENELNEATNANNSNQNQNSNAIKNPDDWTTGDEPMTAAQRSYLQTLFQDSGEAINENLTKSEAAKLINERQQNGQQNSGSNAVKDPAEWKTGDEPMTGAQRSYLKTLSDEAGEQLDEALSKADASKRIDELQHKTGRGINNNNQ